MKPTLFLSLFLILLACTQSMENLVNPEIEKKVDKLLSQMTLKEKIGQMTQVDYTALKNFDEIEKYAFGSVLWGGGSEIDDISPEGWLNETKKLQKYAAKTRLKIPLIFGIDAVHGHNNVNGAVISPHNIGLGCANNPKLVEKVARVTAAEIAATGINWTFSPCVAVARNEKWGRTYESFSEDPDLAELLAAAKVRGYQGKDLSGSGSVLSCTKHYAGDGGTENGDDQGDTKCDEQTFRKLFVDVYAKSIEDGTGSIMASYNTWNGAKMHGNKYLLTDVLKNEMQFNGFIVSDWAAIDQLPGDYKSDIEKSINAGLDMIMIPYGPPEDNSEVNDYVKFITYLEELVNENEVSLSRIDDAVRRILRIKYLMGLFEASDSGEDNIETVGSKEHREIVRSAVRESLVLLKNENNVLPLPKKSARIHFAGKGADNIGMQCGGWTISWQGEMGDVIDGGTSILDAAKKCVDQEKNITYSEDGSGAEGADFAVVVVGEKPYAEMFGDKDDLSLSPEDMEVVENVKATGVPFVIVLLSGRPMIINDALDKCDAFVAAWLPGTEGNGITDVLFGDYNFTGKLSFTWPKSMDQIPINLGDVNYDPLFKFGYGLKY